jgi:uncharacterized protein YbjT (DUF2867 family)
MDLVTGATGYVGGRLVPRLVEGGVHDPSTLPAALDGIEVAYYLVHGTGERAAIFGNLVRRVAERDRALAGDVLPRGTP